MLNVYLLVDTSGSMSHYKSSICAALHSFAETNKAVKITYINFSDEVHVYANVDACCNGWQDKYTNLGGAFEKLCAMADRACENFVVLISDGEHSVEKFGSEERIMRELKGFPAIVVALGVGSMFPTKMFMRYRMLFQGVDKLFLLPPVIAIERTEHVEEAFNVLQGLMDHREVLIEEADSRVEPEKAINQIYVWGSQIPFLNASASEQATLLDEAVREIEGIQKAQKDCQCTDPNALKALNKLADEYCADLRVMKKYAVGVSLLNMGNADLKRMLTKNSKGYALHNIGSYSKEALKRNGGDWEKAMDSWVDFLKGFQWDGPESEDDTITGNSEEKCFREAQLTVANLHMPPRLKIPDTLPEWIGRNWPMLQLPVAEGLAERIEANRALLKSYCKTIVDAMHLFPTPVRGVTLPSGSRNPVAVELWRASIVAMPTILQKINTHAWLEREMCLEYRGEKIDGFLVSSKHVGFLNSAYGHWLQTYALTGNVQLCNPLSVLVGFGVLVVRVLREPLTEHSLDVLDEVFAMHERLPRQDNWESYIKFASGPEFRKALVHSYRKDSLTCGGLGKFVLAALLAAKRNALPMKLLVTMRGAFLREMFAQSKHVKHPDAWFMESFDVTAHLACLDLKPVFESNYTVEEAVQASKGLPKWCGDHISTPKTMYTGGEWEFNAPAVDMIFRNLATLVGTSLSPLTPEDLMGVFAMPNHASDVRAVSTIQLKPATVGDARRVFLDTEEPHMQTRLALDGHVRREYYKWYMSTHFGTLPVPAEYAAKAGASVDKYGIGGSGLFTTACGAWGCPFYGKVVGEVRRSETGEYRMVDRLLAHISPCCVTAMHKTLTRMEGSDEDVTAAVAAGVFVIPDSRLKLGKVTWDDLLANIRRIRAGGGPTYEEWAARLAPK